ncbi:Hypothetical protein EMIHUDRAFT_465525 [Emiliania huxleyi CCMP1516]|uniref:Ankyrin repeat protein n=2 Tax=Emiliania huxleyi TaxID=2903 RepID=A0A0D3IBF1_EMIH1|nr:Hypothetical protein EMIHUDRAFT_465525 [Emiliania huxleyi CCMP1516]EOD08586.1 Hypothetical protein EMIHUDRAFT_465525 [Emiliania huxleyi CCMP1516]|eukprot:XP_005761015.1 Hypothetical protein EMIHUDRAFT_465525 [Emiliania huxleyi CCMP1516]
MAASHTSLRQKRARAHLALHTAVRRYDVPQIKALIEDGAELTEVDEFGRTSLHLAIVAASQSHRQPNGDATVREMVSALLAGDVEALCEVLCLHSDAGLTPLHLAARCGNSSLMGVLLDSIDEEVLSDVMEMRTQLTGDLYSGNWGKKDADTGELRPGGTRREQHGALLGPFPEAGADPAATGCKPIGTANTVLHQAAARDCPERRPESEIEISRGGQNGLTPLCMAARSNKARTNKRAAILRLFGEEA